MGPAETARADQILAVLREADGPVVFRDLFLSLGSPWASSWSVVATAQLLRTMYDLDLVDVAAPACCPIHARWTRPADN